MVTISSDPIFTGPVKSDFINRRTASTHSSTYKNERVCWPSPHTSISPPSGVSAAFRHIAAGAFSFPPFHVPSGPKILWKRAIRTFSPKFLEKARYKRSENNFSHPYSESGLAGYAEDSLQLGFRGSS